MPPKSERQKIGSKGGQAFAKALQTKKPKISSIELSRAGLECYYKNKSYYFNEFIYKSFTHYHHHHHDPAQ